MRKLSNHNNSEINKKTLFHTHTKIKYIDLYTNLPKKKKEVGMSYPSSYFLQYPASCLNLFAVLFSFISLLTFKLGRNFNIHT